MKNFFTGLVFLLLPLAVSAQMSHHGMHMMPAKDDAPESTKAYLMANHAMHQGMNIDFTGDADIDFLRGMIPHHQGAIDMANVQLAHGQDGTIKKMTKKVIRDQKLEIASMERILARLEATEKSPKWHGRAIASFKKTNKIMHHGMNIDFSGNADLDFVHGMIPHHQGAVDMSHIVLKHGRDPNVRRLAHNIINAQETEITWMKTWLRKLKLRFQG